MRGFRAKLCVMWRGCRNAGAGGWDAEVVRKIPLMQYFSHGLFVTPASQSSLDRRAKFEILLVILRRGASKEWRLL